MSLVSTGMAKIDSDIGFPSAEAVNAIVVTAATDTTEKEITVTLPAGASIVRATLLAYVTAMNNSANAQKIDVDVQGRLSGGAWSMFFSQDTIMGFGAVDGATTGIMAISNVTALVTATGTYGFKCTITQSSANSVRYTTQYVLILTLRF